MVEGARGLEFYEGRQLKKIYKIRQAKTRVTSERPRHPPRMPMDHLTLAFEHALVNLNTFLDSLMSPAEEQTTKSSVLGLNTILIDYLNLLEACCVSHPVLRNNVTMLTQKLMHIQQTGNLPGPSSVSPSQMTPIPTPPPQQQGSPLGSSGIVPSPSPQMGAMSGYYYPLPGVVGVGGMIRPPYIMQPVVLQRGPPAQIYLKEFYQSDTQSRSTSSSPPSVYHESLLDDKGSSGPRQGVCLDERFNGYSQNTDRVPINYSQRTSYPDLSTSSLSLNGQTLTSEQMQHIWHSDDHSSNEEVIVDN